MPMTGIQKRITDWCELCFGAEHMASPLIRGLRLLEEAIEFAQSVDVPVEKCRRLIDYVYSRPKGTPAQELGGVGVCLHAAASSISESTEDLVEREISRCEAKPPGHFTARNQTKVDAGFDASPAGSTKPTYSELETENLRVRGLLQRSQEFLRSAIKQAWLSNERQIKDFLKEAESADIGKLDAADKSDACNYSRFSEETGAMCSRGVRGCTGNHKSGVFYCRNNHDPCDESFSTEALRDEHESDCHEAFLKIYAGVEMGKVSSITFSQGAPPMAGTPSIASAGSAETGGETAARESEIVELSLQAWQYAAYIGEWDAAQAEEWRAEAEAIEIKLHRAVSDLAKLRGLNFKQFPNFPRTSQNQTVSSGVEGAHEGTTADKSGSREPEKLYRCKNSDNLHAVMGVPCPDCKLEPEKLNNAPFDKTDDWEARQDAGRQVPNVAESSLSSPPNKEKL